MLRLLGALGGLCFGVIAVSALFHACFLATAWLISALSDDPACRVFWAWPFPFATCPGLNWPDWLHYMASLPGALVSLPLVAHQVFAHEGAALQPFILVAVLINVIGWAWVLLTPVRWIIRRTGKPAARRKLRR